MFWGVRLGAVTTRIVPSRRDERIPEGRINLYALPRGLCTTREPYFFKLSIFVFSIMLSQEHLMLAMEEPPLQRLPLAPRSGG